VGKKMCVWEKLQTKENDFKTYFVRFEYVSPTSMRRLDMFAGHKAEKCGKKKQENLIFFAYYAEVY
jgi:hypothetical protein